MITQRLARADSCWFPGLTDMVLLFLASISLLRRPIVLLAFEGDSDAERRGCCICAFSMGENWIVDVANYTRDEIANALYYGNCGDCFLKRFG